MVGHEQGQHSTSVHQAKFPDQCSFSQRRQNHRIIQTTSSKPAPPEKLCPLKYLGHQLHRLYSHLLQALKRSHHLSGPPTSASEQAEPVVSAVDPKATLGGVGVVE